MVTTARQYIAVFPIVGPEPLPRLKRQAIDQLTLMVPADVTICGDWSWSVIGKHPAAHLVARADAEGPLRGGSELAREIRTALPSLAAWIDEQSATQEPLPQIVAPRPSRAKPKRGSSRQRLAELDHLLVGGVCVEDAIVRCGWTTKGAAYQAAVRQGLNGLASTLNTAA